MRRNGYLWTSGVNLDTAVRFAGPNLTIHCRVIAFLSANTSHDLDLWSFDFVHTSCMASHVTNTATRYEDPMPIRSCVMSYNVSRWLLLRMRTRLLRMRRITWPVRTGSKKITFLVCWTVYPDLPIHYATGGSTMKVIKVMCENNSRHCVKRRMSFCACAKSRDLLKVS